jgi:hypothetical protein
MMKRVVVPLKQCGIEINDGKGLGFCDAFSEGYADFIMAMHEALPALLADSERWEWIEAHRGVLRESGDDGGEKEWWVSYYNKGGGISVTKVYGSPREAVDAAMERDAQGGKG